MLIRNILDQINPYLQVILLLFIDFESSITIDRINTLHNNITTQNKNHINRKTFLILGYQWVMCTKKNNEYPVFSFIASGNFYSPSPGPNSMNYFYLNHYTVTIFDTEFQTLLVLQKKATENWKKYINRIQQNIRSYLPDSPDFRTHLQPCPSYCQYHTKTLY